MRLLRFGSAGLLVELASTAQVTAAYHALRSARLPDVVELVPAARTVLVEVAPGAELPIERIRALVAETDDAPDPPEPGDELVIPVRYDGADLDLVARTAELSVSEVIELHASAAYTVAFCGFAPGFGYLVGLPERLHQPRLAEPRPSVPAGAVGIAGEYSAVYPRSSPGGWRLLGRTDEVMFDPRADPPARLAPGDRVRFEPVR